MKTSTLSTLCFTLLLGTVPVIFSSGTAAALSDKAVEMRAEQAAERSHSTESKSARNERASAVLAEKEEVADVVRFCLLQRDGGGRHGGFEA